MTSIHEERDGTLWFGTVDGIARYKDGQMLAVERGGGPLGETILGMVEDESGKLWTTTNTGLFALSLAQLNAYVDGGAIPTFLRYGHADGLRAVEFDGANTSPGTRTPDGALWFPSIRGIVRVDPDALHTNTLAPPVLIEATLADGEPIVRYDLILMDCQMPELDGYEATREIRRIEAAAGNARIPIVALTAHAIQGTELQCREAGMDDYLTKPLDRDRLADTLGRHLGDGSGGSAAATPVEREFGPAVDEGSAPVGWPGLLESLDGDLSLAREIAETYIGSGNNLLADLAVAVDCGDWATAGSKAHSLKGARANIRAGRVAEAAGRLEAAVRAGEAGRIAALAETLMRDLDAATDYLRSRAA